MYVVGTAGHVDHGKSTLVQALTGMDPDRLAEEKERGLTIDLGFAWMTLPDGLEVSIVDVPGHERFVSNMLAGVGAIDMALLVVAADESVMPQTREHLAILELLGVPRGLVAITKCDLVDAELAELVAAEVEDLLDGTSLAGSEAVEVSGATGRGVDELAAAMARKLSGAGARRDVGRARLSVDRSFTMPGFGTVVTGTLTGGALEVGDEVELVVSGVRARIRGLQSHRSRLERALPGRRVAVNLSGAAHDSIGRGDVLARPGWLRPTTSVDVRLTVLSDAPRALRHNMHVTVHSGSAETVGRLRLLEGDRAEPGGQTWAQLKLEVPIATVRGDRIVIRSNSATLGGGTVVDPRAPRHRRRHAPLLDRLTALEGGSASQALAASIDLRGPIDLGALAAEADMAPDEVEAEVGRMEAVGDVIALGAGPARCYLSAAAWGRIAERARRSVADHHRRFPARPGEPREELRSRLGLVPALFGPALERLVDSGTLAEAGAAVRLPDHRPRLTADQRARADAFIASLASADPYSPPTDALPDEDVLEVLEAEGQVVRAGASVVFTAEAYVRMVEAIGARAAESGQVTVGDVRDMFGTSRKYALALMEHLDRTRVTRRVGDARVMR